MTRNKLVAAVILGALALVGLLAGIFFWTSGPTVPDVVGQTQSAAERSVGNDYTIDVDEVRVDSKPKGTIIEQNPDPGEPVKQGSPISVIVSAGRPPDPGDIYKDDFSNTSSGWDQDRGPKDNRWITDYADGSYRILAFRGSLSTMTSGAGTVDDAIVEVNATRTSDDVSQYAAWGIACRMKGWYTYYSLEIYSNGSSAIYRDKGDNWKLLASGAINDAVHEGWTTNHLRADCIGSKLTLYVNGQKVVEAEDSELQSGQVGLMVDNGGKPSSIEVLFDDFSVSSP